MFSHFEMTLSVPELIKRTAHESMSDDAQGLASQLAYYFFLALFPALLCLLAIASFLPLQNFTDDMLRVLGPFAPQEMLEVIRQQMLKIAEGQRGGLVTLGLLGAMWSSSAAMVALIGAMNRAYDIDEGRPWWRIRLTAIGLTVVLSLFIVVAFALILIGPQLADFIARRMALGGIFVWTWKILQWPLVFAMVTLAIGLIYYFAPDAEQLWVWVTPGSLVATGLWLIGSLAFRFYAVNFGHYEATYGTLGGVILLLLWFYMSGFVIVIGAEMNAEIEHTSPWGKAPGEKVPGQRKQIGAAAARTWYQSEKRAPTQPSIPNNPAPTPTPALHPPSVRERLAAVLTLFILWLVRRRRSDRRAHTE